MRTEPSLVRTSSLYPPPFQTRAELAVRELAFERDGLVDLDRPVVDAHAQLGSEMLARIQTIRCLLPYST